MEIEPKYFEHPDFSIRCIEWHALKEFVYGGNLNAICERPFPIRAELDAMARYIRSEGQANATRSNASSERRHASVA